MFISIIAVVLLVAVLACTLSACLKIGLKQANVIKRLKDHGATVSYERSSPVISEWQSKGISIKDILLAVMPEAQEVVDGSTLDEDSSDEQGESSESVSNETLYIFYANDKESADWIEDRCKEYKSAEENAEIVKYWNIYRYENIVMIGDYKLLAVARQY